MSLQTLGSMRELGLCKGIPQVWCPLQQPLGCTGLTPLLSGDMESRAKENFDMLCMSPSSVMPRFILSYIRVIWVFLAKQEIPAISGVKYINLIHFLYCLCFLFEVSGEDRTQSSEPKIRDSWGVNLQTLKVLQVLKLPQHTMEAIDECPDQLECLKTHSYKHTKKPFFKTPQSRNRNFVFHPRAAVEVAGLLVTRF